MRYPKKIILLWACFATVISLMTVSASAEWSADVGYYGNIPFQVLIDVRDAANRIIDDQYHKHRMEIAFDTDLQCYRLRYTDSDAWYLHPDGTFPYTIAQGDVETNVTSPSVQSANGWWLPGELSDNIEIKSKALLESICANLITDGHDCRLVETLRFGGRHWVIQDYSTDGGANRIYGTPDRRAYAAIVGDSATDIERDYLDADGNSVGGTKVLDFSGNTLTLIDDSGAKINLDIGSVNFDTGDKSYTVNAYYTDENNYYTYYTYNITYNITNTYIAYIGSNDAYESKEYELYYELPDGRSSADLTADEIAGMSFEFHDVVNYAKSATDVSVRALYHFDGDLEDSSYFSGQGSCSWYMGASITYMDSGVFDGALYFDANDHVIDFHTPTVIGSSDFTVQFRYHQTSAPDSVPQSIAHSVGTYETCFIQWDEEYFYDPAMNVLAQVPVGTWNEVGIVRNNGIFYYYLNGLCIGSYSYPNSITTLVNYCHWDHLLMLDELRVLNFALVEGGASYTPSTVPYDSNLVLVLPDSARPIADEYWDVHYGGDNLLGTKLSDYTSGVSGAFREVTGSSASFDLPLYYFNESTSVLYYEGYTRVVNSGNTLSSGQIQKDGVILRVHYHDSDDRFFYGDKYDPGTYTFSVVLSDGSVCSSTFTMRSGGSSPTDSLSYFDWGYIGLVNRYSGSYGSSYLVLYPYESVDIIYMELVAGASTDLSAERITCIYPSEKVQPNTAAIQTTIPVNGYTVGGVRPTFPARGDVWFPVQENRIQACYIYTGSMWQEVGCRWYTGSRWIPIYAFDLVTLEDLFDIADAADAVVPITSESAFWRWWQLQWLDFREYLDSKFDELIAAITGGSSGSGSDIGIPNEEGNSEFSFSDLAGVLFSSILEIATTVLTEFIGLIADLIKMFIQAVMDFVGGFVSVLADAAGHIAILGDNVAPIGDFVSGIYDAIPDDIEAVLTGSFVVVVAVSVISFLL